MTVKRHHKSLPPASPRPVDLPPPPFHLHPRPSCYSLPPYGIRTLSRHRPPRALYGPGRSEMVACLSGSLRAAVKAADPVSRRLSAESRVAKKMRRESQVFSGSFRRTKRRRCPPPCQGSIPRRRCIPISNTANAHLARRKGLVAAMCARATGEATAATQPR